MEQITELSSKLNDNFFEKYKIKNGYNGLITIIKDYSFMKERCTQYLMDINIHKKEINKLKLKINDYEKELKDEKKEHHKLLNKLNQFYKKYDFENFNHLEVFMNNYHVTDNIYKDEEIINKDIYNHSEYINLNKYNENLLYENNKQLIYNNVIKKIKEDHKKEMDNLISRYNKKEKLSNSNKNKKYTKNVDIFVYNNINNKWQKYISNDTFYDIKSKKKLKELIDKERSTLNEVEEWSRENTKNSCRTKRYYIKKQIERSMEIYNLYGEKLQHVDFSINNVARLPKDQYKLWKEDLKNAINKKNKKRIKVTPRGDQVM